MKQQTKQRKGRERNETTEGNDRGPGEGYF